MTTNAPLRTVGLLGGGVIGGGWAARFALSGIDVKLFDVDPEAPRKMGEIMTNARRAYSKLTLAPLPKEGTITFAKTVEDAVTGVDFVQESLPERLELKQKVLAQASKAAAPDTVFGSSTSGLLPTEIQRDMVNPERFVVGHPFNPVYLMPLVEICGGERTSQATKDRAREVYTYIGMQPLMLSKEIDGFIADRLMEALWREALWLVNDGVATAEEIDDAMRFGPGLRWSFMGRHALRTRSALVVHGHVPHLSHRRRRAGHAPLHGPVRTRTQVAVDEVHERAGAHRRVARHDLCAIGCPSRHCHDP